MKIHVTMNDRLLEQVDKMAGDLFTSRSGFISFACAYYIQTRHMNLQSKPYENNSSELDGEEKEKSKR